MSGYQQQKNIKDPLPCIICKGSFKHLKEHTRLAHSSQRPYKCTSCPKSFKVPYVLKLHLITHSNQKPYKCYSCSKSFNNPGSLSHHKKIHDSDDISCDSCSKVFINKLRMKTHKKRYHDGLIETTKCPVCSKQIENNLFKVHSYTHTGEKPFVCSTCERSFNNNGSLFRHRKLHSEKRYSCNFCTKTYPSEDHLDMHKKCHISRKTAKGGLKPVKKITEYKVCKICLQSVKDLNEHRMGVHSTDRDFNCEHCTKTYKTANVLEDHMKRKHTNILSYQCSTCDKKFNVNRVLKKHIEQHVNENIKCKICNKSFPSLASVEAHEKSHNKKFVEIRCELCPKLVREVYMEKHLKFHGSQVETCTICQKVFKTDLSLKEHEQTHIERKRNFQCNVCNSKMYSMNLLKQHNLIHTTEKPYACTIENCYRRFNNTGSLSRHKRTHTNLALT